ncbi:hypothetical protein CPB97_003584 [Podila verticillata]|nr:hypothetical protein CPB97_003584 [Podila verticillata]
MKFLSAITTLAVLAVTQAFQEGPGFGMRKSCSSGTPIFQAYYGSPNIFPMPFCPQAESDYIYFLRGNLSEPLVQGSKLIISARVSGKLVYSDTQDYCKLLNVQSQGCPVPANQTVVMYTRVPKKNMPIEGPVDYTYQAVTPDGRDIYCWTSTLSGPKCNPIPTPTTTTPAPTATSTPLPLYPISRDCATGATDQNVTDFNLTPSDYCIGKPYTLTTAGSLSTDIIEGAKMSLIGRFLNRIVYTDSQDLCALLAAAGTPCPIAKTANTLSFALTAKPILPAGIPFAYQYLATNGNGHTIFCRATNRIAKTCA